VGAGLGGLACALELARQGFSVCVLEQHNKPGGYAHGFQRRGYRFDVSLHHIGGLDQGAMIRDLLQQLGVLDKLRLHRRKALWGADHPGLSIELPNDMDELLSTLGRRFPHQRRGLGELFRHLRELKHHVTGPWTDPSFDLPVTQRLSTRYADSTILQVIRRFLDDPALIGVLCQPWMYIGLPPSQATATFSACVLCSTLMEGAYHIKGGGAALSQAMADRLRELGGRCVTRAPVRRIVIENGAVAGVQLRGGQGLSAGIVVSNANPFQTFHELLSPNEVSRAYRMRLDQMKPSLSFYALYLGLDCLPSQLGLEHETHFCNYEADLDRAYERTLRHEIHHTDWCATSYQNSDPDLAPPGCGVVAFAELTPAADWLSMDRASYVERKAAVREILLNKYEARFPGLARHAAVQEFATPRTMVRFSRNHQGAVYGLEQSVPQSNRRRLRNRTPVRGLYLTGAWTWAGGGYEGALMSGLQTVATVLAEVPPPHPLARRRLGAPPERLPPIPSMDTDEDAAYPHRLPLEVFPDAADALGTLRPDALLGLLDRGRVEACEAACADSAQESWLERYLVNVYRMDLRLMAPCRPGELLEVRTGLRRSSSHRSVFDQRVLRQRDGQPIAEAAVEITFRDRDAGLVPVPPGFEDRPAPSAAPAGSPAPIPFSQKDHFGYGIPQRVYYEDTDAQGIVYHAAYLRYCQRALYALLREKDETQALQAMRSHRWVIRYLRAVGFGTRLEVRLGVRPAPGGRLLLDQRVLLAASGTVVVDAVSEISFASPGRTPKALRALLAGPAT